MTVSNPLGSNNLAALASSPFGSANTRPRNAPGSWFEALASAWGTTLDNQATQIEAKTADMGSFGTDQPSSVVELTTESLRMSFLANSSSTSIDSVGKALETMARKG